MSYDVNVSFKKWPEDGQALWVAEMRRMGITVEVADDAFSSTGFLPLKLTVEPGATIPWAATFRALGTFESGFERTPGAKRIRLSASTTEGNAGAIWSAAAIAAITKGKLEDPQASVTASGKRAIDIIATLMRNEDFVKSFAGPETMGELPPPGPFSAPLPELEVDIDENKPTREYSAASVFAEDEQVSHPTFGVGLVELSELGKVTIAFRSGRRVLAQSKASSEGLTRPGRIDHSAPTPGSKRQK